MSHRYGPFEIAASDRNLEPGQTGQAVNESAWWWRFVADGREGPWRRSDKRSFRGTQDFLDGVQWCFDKILEDDPCGEAATDD